MKIYIDFDDCLCETAREFTNIGLRLFGKNVPYEQIRFFNLQDSFGLNDSEYREMMIEGHKPEVLLSYKETPGAGKVVNDWIDKGYDVSIITGRPFNTFEASRGWLDEHGLKRVKLFFLDKYGRDPFLKQSDYNLTPEEYYRMKFDYAIEDSPLAFRFFEHLPDLKVMLYDRPWNHECSLPNANYQRCPDWEYIKRQVGGKQGEHD
ncbi:MAG: 2-dehydropantoate 2-reductase [Lachnospiraceae bacterium]|nr:2-dehydropantoate 2-reductase [Lachnospiraceae bacterium]